MEEEDPQLAAFLRQFVLDALLTKASGESPKLYDQLVGQIRQLKVAAATHTYASVAAGSDKPPSEQFAKLLRALTRCAGSLQERKHEVLITEVLDIPLWRAAAPTRIATLDFIAHAVVANGALVQSCLHTLVYSLLPPPAPAPPDPLAGQAWAPTAEAAAVQDSVLSAAEKVLELVPTSAQRLLPLLTANMPHKLRDRNTHCLYLRALFRLAESRAGAGVRDGVLAAVVDHLIAVDVEIRWEDIVDVATAEAKEEEGGNMPGEEEPDIFELEGMSELDLVSGRDLGEEVMPGGGWEGGHARGLPATTAAAAAAAATAAEEANAPLPAVDETADKLDSMMELTMEHLGRRIASGQLPAVWDATLVAFDRSVLNTYRSKFVQFLMFFLARHAPEQCCSSLVGFLLARISDRLQPPITRSAAAAYAGSFLARAGFVPEPLVVEALQRLADWCVRYTREEDRRGGLPPIPSAVALGSLASSDARERHTAFFAACQALLYALCYHMEPLLRQNPRSHNHCHDTNNAQQRQGNGNGNHHAAAEMNGNGGATGSGQDHAAAAAQQAQQQAAACAEAIRRLFAEVMPGLLTHALDPLSSCARSVVLEFGRQAGTLGHPELSKLVRGWDRRRAAGSTARTARPLEVFFPFDPYLLRRSAQHLQLEGTYVLWRRGHPTGAPRAGLTVPDDGAAGGRDDMSESSGLEDDSSSDDGIGSSDSERDSDEEENAASSSSSSSSSDDSSSSESEGDDPRRSRFGSMPDSSLSSGGRRFPKGRRLPGALKASLGGAGTLDGSPTMGVPIPGGVGSLSTDNGMSPWGMSPAAGGYCGSFAPMSLGDR